MELKIELQHSLKNCFTCLRQSEECMQISSEPSDPNSMTVVELLTKHLWFQQDDFNKQPHVICWSCWNRLDDFHRFYQEVEQNHRTLNQELPNLSGCKVEPKLMDDADSNDIAEIQHDEVDVKEEIWDESKPESSSDEENSEEGERELEESPLENRVLRPRKAIQKRRIEEPGDDVDELIKTHMQYVCSVCKNNCPTFHQLKRHMKNVHKMRGCITCCGRKFYKKLVLLEHVQKLQDPDRFKCDICHKILINSGAVRRHKREIHAMDEQKMYRCGRCPNRFVRPSLLEYHLKGHENLEKGTIKCPHCEKSYPTTARMNRHIKVCHERRDFVCDVCEKGFVSKPDFLRHKEQHKLSSDELRVQCDICHKWLKNKNTWRMHYRRHTDPMACNLCGHVAIHAVALSDHKRIHHLSKPRFICETCGKKFQLSNELKRHRVVHYEGTLYPCNLCDKKFIHISNMRTHQRTKHPKEWFEQKNELKDVQSVANYDRKLRKIPNS